MHWLPLTVLMLVSAASSPVSASTPAPFPGYTATYEAQVLGNTLTVQSTLSHEGENVRMAMDAHVSGFLRLLGRFEFNRETLLQVDGAEIRPLQSRSVQITPRRERRVETRFDWPAGRAQGQVNQDGFALEIPGGTQDYLSSIYLTIDRLRRGDLDNAIRVTILERTRIRSYTMGREGTERLDTVLGPLETVQITRRDTDSDVALSSWFAEGLGYVPVRLDYEADGSVYQLNLTRLEWHDPLTAPGGDVR
ncbi:hypothetical protein TVNIR_3401 [Thioalkalivibrio nitratireducens DSM 14787]|uniref:DUF3108 domain-containing protein n=1 Tax=Thioalkalivibrio nitratireducens (strain DSM 14787 / UNIQEM 213 / ALEN2) TaxID=1255043 RepID=L0E1B1_THIND|nr:DUF3108 domain-containing protein [Thioalkalivibrio nitratireducens]AGA35037.1 hypothetical protein TVNIR_3401 [Thioalkalivibrio nitratireducens DSM 14787]